MQAPPNPYLGLTLADKKKWICVYPVYINSRKTIVEGRRIPKAKAVDNPLCSEICDVCKAHKLNAEIETEHYHPKELVKDYLHQGRVRVQLYNQDGIPCNDAITTRHQLLALLGEMIPKLKTRIAASGGSGSSGGEPAANTQTSAPSKKKKGKKK
ncbi:hypothetical protein EMCRGX_G030607 [Ephydatia muelleri]